MKRIFPILFLVFAIEKAGVGADPKDRWIEKTDTDKLTDTRRTYMTLMAENRSWLSRNWPSLSVGCEGIYAFFVVSIATPAKVGPSGRVLVTSRFGNLRPVTQNWYPAAGGTVLSMTADPFKAAVSLTRADTFLMRYTPKEGEDVTLEFALVGANNHLPKIAQACGWDWPALLRVH